MHACMSVCVCVCGGGVCLASVSVPMRVFVVRVTARFSLSLRREIKACVLTLEFGSAGR